MILLYYILVGILFLTICYLTGDLLCDLLSLTYSRTVIGFVGIISVFYVISFPFLYFNGDFTVLFYIFGFVMTVAVLISVCHMYKKHCISTGDYKSKSNSNSNCNNRDGSSKTSNYSVTFLNDIKCRIMNIKGDHIMIIALILIGVQVIALYFFAHYDSDDSYYVARTSTILHSGFINSMEPSSGIERFPMQAQYAMVGYEVFMAWLCRLTGINAAIMFHTVMPGVFLVLHYLAVNDLGRELFGKKKNIFLIIFILYNLLSAYSIDSQGIYAMIRIWQGKSVMICVLIPLLILVFLRLFKDNKPDIKILIVLFGILTSGICLTTIGVYFMPVAYGLLTVVYGINQLIKRYGIMNFFKLCIPVLSFIPFVMIIYLKLRQDNTIEGAVYGLDGFVYPGFYFSINDAGCIWLFFIVAVLYYLICEQGRKRYLFGILPLFTFVTILNPLISKYVAGYITGVPVYWRLFWLLHLNIVLVSFAVDVILKLKKKYIQIAVVIVMFGINGVPVFTPEYFGVAHNYEKNQFDSQYITKCILEDHGDGDTSLFVHEDYSYGVRQYTGRIILVWSRYTADYYIDEDRYAPIEKAYANLYTFRMFNKQVLDTLKDYDTEYLVLYNDTEVDEDVSPFIKKIGGQGEYGVYKLIS